ncbi:MAG: hypothetical protein ABEJ65_05435 [bacterium]
MGDLEQSDPLTVNLGAPDYNTINCHPNEGKKIDCWESERSFNLYLDMDAFIHAEDDFVEINFEQLNDCDKGVIVIKNQLKKDLGNPEEVKIFRKNDNIFLKST